MEDLVERILGIDLGIASCGWAVIEMSDGDGRILGAGVRCWEAPEVPKTREPKNHDRRLARGQRRVIRRRRQRMGSIRKLFAKAGLLPDSNHDALRTPGIDPWRVRAEGLDRLLAPAEFAVALGHIARHRGFRSNSKRDHGANAPSETSLMLKAMEATRGKLSKYRTVGEMFLLDPEFEIRKRNRGDYTRSILRRDLEDEVTKLFERQRALGNTGATELLQREYSDIAFFQRRLADSWDKVGLCPFELEEKRAAKHSPSFELFRFLARLNTLRVGTGRTYRALTEAEIRAAMADFASTKGMTFARLRRVAAIAEDRFQSVAPDDEKTRDVVTRTKDGAAGTVALKECLGDSVWSGLLQRPEVLDRIAAILTFFESPESMQPEFIRLGLDPIVAAALTKGVANGAFAKFKGAGHISAKAARNVIPHLMRGLTYDKACAEAGYNHTQRIETEITNPVARKAVLEAEKQIRAIVRQYGMPDRIHIELARDVGKSAEERKEISNGIEKRNKQKDRLRDVEFPDAVGRPPHSAEEMLRFELWKEQAGKCLYTDENISPGQIAAGDNSVQVDHILPWSRFGDDSFMNRTLCTARANQQKKGRTPFEWFKADKTEAEWEAFRARVETNKHLRGYKKRNYLLLNAEEVEERFKTRNLNDTRYAARALMARLDASYPPELKSRRVFARPGALTQKLRRAWGVDDLKKDPATRARVEDDRHHALDAIVLAATSESALIRLTRAFQEAERKGLAREFGGLDLPWRSFIGDARAAYLGVFVSRGEIRRARGKAHDATIKQVREANGEQVVYERKAVDKLTLADLDRIPVPEPYGRIADPSKLRDGTVAALRAWIDAGKPKSAPPRSPRGDVIRKVRVATKSNVAVGIRGGTADRGEMVRVDVFVKPNAKGIRQFFLVPIYPHEVATLDKPPNRAVQGGAEESRWPLMDSSYEFLWSIYPMSLLELTKADGVTIEGYFKGLDRSTGAINVAEVTSNQKLAGRSIGARSLASFRKLSVDRLGRVSEVARETRTWRGVVCI
ncbi:MAG: type II CRISPR RNA-guided endonuclease Cas9 [Hyphomicrobiaceae bacterium]|nr:MAG: type II CRISPR RNA-guided endonuclease Cas9 [Hyphomicrobiaceae bacterium]